METKFKLRIIYVSIIICIGGVIIITFIHTLVRDNKITLKQTQIDSVTFLSKPDSNYNKDLNSTKNYNFVGAVYSKTRSPFEVFTYKNCYIFIYRLPIISDKSLQEILKINQTKLLSDFNFSSYELVGPFISIDHSNYDIRYKIDKPNLGYVINLNLSDNNFRLLKKNDTIFSCYANLGKFSIDYNTSNTPDFYGEISYNSNISSLPLQITFLKKQNHYYILMMIQKD